MHRYRSNNKKKITIVSAAIAALVLPTAAWAAVELFGFGSFNSAAATTQNLVIDGNPTTTKSLVPGQTVGVKGNVKNPNDFPVKVTGIIIKKNSEVLTPNTPSSCKISFAAGSTVATFPAQGSNPAVPNSTAFTLAAPVEIAAGATKEIVVPNVLKQDASATKVCGVKADYAVRTTIGS